VRCGQYVTRAKRKNGCEFFPSTREYAQQYGVDKTILDSWARDMHPGPISIAVWEITSEVADSNQSVILNQVENGVAIVRMAVMASKHLR
jgi:aspartate carbamoyltransferase catalytic subunit